MKLKGPETVMGTPDEAAYAARHEALIARQQLAGLAVAVHARKEDVIAFVSEGRWVGDCPNCRAGISLHADWTAARCFQCGAVYAADQIAWPADFDAIETELATRPLINQNWLTHETVEDLVAEHAEADAREAGARQARAARMQAMKERS